jgi:hypothetical protein
VGLITDDFLPDIVLTYTAFDRSSVNVNNGNFNFTEVVLEQTFIGEAFVMDIDNQGTDDFVFVDYYSNTIPLYKFIGNDQFELQSNFYASGTYTIASFLTDDFNQDSYDDFIISRCNWYDCTDSIYVYLSDQNWSFYESQRYYIGYLGFFNLKSADLNGDSFPDLYMSGAGTNGNKTLKILWNDGTGNFSYENPVGIKETPNPSPLSLSVSPNPFSDQVKITVNANEGADLSVTVYDIIGRKVKGLHPPAGGWSPPAGGWSHFLTLTWNGFDDSGLACPAGLYMIVVEGDNRQIYTKVVKSER